MSLSIEDSHDEEEVEQMLQDTQARMEWLFIEPDEWHLLGWHVTSLEAAERPWTMPYRSTLGHDRTLIILISLSPIISIKGMFRKTAKQPHRQGEPQTIHVNIEQVKADCLGMKDHVNTIGVNTTWVWYRDNSPFQFLSLLGHIYTTFPLILITFILSFIDGPMNSLFSDGSLDGSPTCDTDR
ncbi:hypothetical protein BJY52DRAFT_1227728 [Lactarius psammicola]|nr:hypothetical protein BJY52DRAFT_1227728 [Lactarius psammicola]